MTTLSLDERLNLLLAGDPGLKSDPYPFYARLRDEAPVHVGSHVVALTTYDLIKQVLLDTERFSNAVQAPGTSRVESARAALTEPIHRLMFDHCVGVERLFLEETDGAAHARRREQCQRLFAPRQIEQLAVAVRELVDDVLDEMAAGSDEVDFEVFAARVPALIVADLLAVPRADADQLGEWSATILANIFGGQGIPALEAAHDAHRAFESYIDAIVREHRSGRRPTELLGALFDARDSEVLTQPQLYALFLELELGGCETTRGLLVGLVYELLRRPEEWRKLVARPDLVENAVEEGVRYVSPVQFVARVAREELVLDGVRIAPETTCLTMIASANRDPAVFGDPDAFSIERDNARHHLGFGFGRHYCLAQALARLEARVALEALIRRFPEAELAIAPQDVEWAGQLQLRRVKTLPVRLGPQARERRRA